MKFAIAFIIFLSAVVAHAACDEPTLIKSVGSYADKKENGYGPRFTKAKIHGILAPGESMEIQISVEDFKVSNTSASNLMYVSLEGSSLAVDKTFWLAAVHPLTCETVSASEALGTGGGGL